jgi:hypothetical protein
MTRPGLFTIRVLVLLLPLAASLPTWGAEPFRYPEARSGKGELKTVAGTPVRLHLALRKGPATRLPLRTLDLSVLLRPEEGRGDKRP